MTSYMAQHLVLTDHQMKKNLRLDEKQKLHTGFSLFDYPIFSHLVKARKQSWLKADLWSPHRPEIPNLLPQFIE